MFEQTGSDFSVEIRVRFPAADDEIMVPTELSGAIWTLSNTAFPEYDTSLWYEKVSAGSVTGTLFLTSSSGRLDFVAPIFSGDFYNLSLVKESVTGSCAIHVMRCEDGDVVFASSSRVAISGTGYPLDGTFDFVELGSSTVNPSKGQFWASEFRLWDAPLSYDELIAHAAHFESYGRERSYNNIDLAIHWRMNDGSQSDAGTIYTIDSSPYSCVGTGSDFVDTSPFDKFLDSFGYIPSIDYGWNQQKVRVFDGSTIDPYDRYKDERFISLELNMYDALNEDISHLMSSYEELGNFLGLPVNRYREDYEGLEQMRETYFKRLQGKLNFKVFANMLDFFDRSFIEMVGKLLPARALFKGDEMIVESHMLERPKYQYQIRPVRDGVIDISGSIAMTDREYDRIA